MNVINNTEQITLDDNHSSSASTLFTMKANVDEVLDKMLESFKSPGKRARIALILSATLCVLFMNLTSAFAQSDQWAVKMFSELGTERIHNFGSVALHANVEKHFPFKNIYNEDVVISSISSNCGCTKATVSEQVIHPGEIGEVIARVDTSGREHTKQRKATIRVVFSKPSLAEVQLQVKTYIRPDVGFDPGVIEFGTVQHGETVVKKAFLQYEGRPDWALIGIQKTNPGIRAEAYEARRRGGSVVYEINVELKSEAAPGYIQDLIKFQTNDRDPATSSIFLPVQGLVVEPLSAKPGFLQLGVVHPGQKVTKNVVISGSEPFKIVKVAANDKRLSYLKTDLKRTVHIVPITFEADGDLGEIESQITVTTSQLDDEGAPQKLTISATGVVVNDGETIGSVPSVSSTRPKKNDLGVPQAKLETSPTHIETETPSIDAKQTNDSAQKPGARRPLKQTSPLSQVKRFDPKDATSTDTNEDYGWTAAGALTGRSNSNKSPLENEWTSNWKEARLEKTSNAATRPASVVPTFVSQSQTPERK